MRDLLARCGIALYGREWVSPLAHQLDINLRTMQRWAAGETEPHPETWHNVKREMAVLLRERLNTLAETREEIARLLQLL